MFKTVIKIEGMACCGCEAHVNEAVRGKLPVKKCQASHTAKEAVILSLSPLDETLLQQVITETGFVPGKISVSEITENAFDKVKKLFKH